MAKYPKDQFDDVPADVARVGAHRGPPRRGRGWVTFAWAMLAIGVLVVGGLYGLSRIGAVGDLGLPFIGSPDEPSASPSVAQTADPLIDPSTIDPARQITLTILNGTTTPNLQNVAGDALAAAGWPVGTRASASTTDEPTTIVYYSNPLDEDVARGVVIALGVGDIRESDSFLGAPINVVLGNDYQPED
jgi:LytR cell envelope-related transcriptional attenuator